MRTAHTTNKHYKNTVNSEWGSLKNLRSEELTTVEVYLYDAIQFVHHALQDTQTGVR